ncbi:hypothetical protein R1sor_020633 [Riccia sorocarpa]|uniref:DNA methylase N-4/N-6 domain-containing protein n=1 Tax=Riccia sorocarpa TaxID=122646 RepID=A0ABD3GHL9_9MARC
MMAKCARPGEGHSKEFPDERKLSILLRVDFGELSLDQMTQECARCKTLDVIMKSFCHLTGCKDWTEAQAKCGPYSTDERLYSFEKSFDLMLVLTPHATHGVDDYLLLAPGVLASTPCVAWGVKKDRSCSTSVTKALFGVDEPEPENGKRKRASKAKSLVQVLPPEFLDHIDSARAYKEAKEAGRAVPLPQQNFKHWVKEGSLQSLKWDVFHGDTRRMQSFVPKQKYTLAIADVPYGFQLKDCGYDDNKPFLKNNVLDMLTQVGLVSSSSYWTLVIFHSLQQANEVAEAFRDFGCKSWPGVWVKPNIKNRMTQNSEYWTVGFWSLDGKISMSHFDNCQGFPETCVIAPACAYKIVLYDGKSANIYQKSQQVINKLLGYFSREDDWVLDLCAGSGTTLDQVPGSAGTGGSEAEDGTEDPEGIDPEIRAVEAEEEVSEHEENLGQEGIVPDSLVGE